VFKAGGTKLVVESVPLDAPEDECVGAATGLSCLRCNGFACSRTSERECAITPGGDRKEDTMSQNIISLSLSADDYAEVMRPWPRLKPSWRD
jgi:hypothetical protein